MLSNSAYGSSTLGYEYEYFVRKPIVQFQTDASGLATVTQGEREYSDLLPQSHLSLQHFHLYLSTGSTAYVESFLRAGSIHSGSNRQGVVQDVADYSITEVPGRRPGGN